MLLNQHIARGGVFPMSDKQQGHANQNTTTRTSDKGSKKSK
ncbi:hypothetical protein [Paenibacillus validus]